MDQSGPVTLELRLLLACAKFPIPEEDEAAIRQMLGEGVDWTIFVQAAIDRGVTSLVAYRLVRTAPDLVPEDILDALRKVVHRTQSRNRELLDHVARTIEANLSQSAVVPIRNACAAADRALSANPSDATAWRTLGRTLFDLGRLKEAIACYDRAIELGPEDAVTWADRANAMWAKGQTETALSDVNKALTLEPQNARAWILRARALSASRRFVEAVEASERALALEPENNIAARLGIQARLFACDWRRREDDKRRITEGLREGVLLIPPLYHRSICNYDAEHLIVARLRAKAVSRSEPVLWRGELYRHDKIRIAYISTDFRDHVVADSIVGCFEHHDSTRFETTAISLGPNDGSEMRQRIEAAFDRFVDVQAMGDAEVAAMLRELEIDIAIDLNGYIGEPRTGILARKPAPVQVNYFGYPGTMGAPFIDYIMADRMVIPTEHRAYYSEQVVHLPHSYLPNDRKRPIADNTPSRSEAGLPEAGFVFACFNAEHKIDPEIFDIWMRLLRTVEGSVLWLSSLNSSAIGNLRRVAKDQNIAPERLIFATRLPRVEDHLARLRLADLFLDTLPYNAHSTACDALWAGLPVLTSQGRSFAGLVATSLLHAIGLPEMVTTSLAEYEQLALTLAFDSKRLASIRAKLMLNRDTDPLFDTERLTRDLESAYTTMWKRQQAGLPPADFAVGPATS